MTNVTGGPRALDYVEDTIKCAGCDDPHGLHHYRIDVYERSEDAKRGLRVTIQDMCLSTSINGVDYCGGNPSCRRDGIRILAWCELCPATTAIEISQHKGATFFVTRIFTQEELEALLIRDVTDSARGHVNR